MQMTLEQIRLKQNPVLTNILLGLGQGTMIAERLFPRLPQALSKVTFAKAGDERLRRYNLRRAPGATTKRVSIKYDGATYEVKQYAVDVPIPRELVRESEAAARFNLTANLDISRIAMVTANDILALDYEIEVAGLATDAAHYAAGHVLNLTTGTKWSEDTGTPISDISDAMEVIRKKIGKRPNRLVLSADAAHAIRHNTETRGYLPSTQMGPASLDQLKSILGLAEVVVGDAVWINDADIGADVWGNNAVLAYVPALSGSSGDISLAEPAFGFTNVIEGHPFAEQPRYDGDAKSWIYGATYERQANIAYNQAAFLFTNCK